MEKSNLVDDEVDNFLQCLTLQHSIRKIVHVKDIFRKLEKSKLPGKYSHKKIYDHSTSNNIVIDKK